MSSDLDDGLGHVEALMGAHVLDEDPDHLGEALALCQAARLLALRVVDGRVKGRSVTTEASAARAAIVMAERAVGDLCSDLSGIGGLVDGATADGQFRNSLAAGIASGTYEMQLNTVASGVLPRTGA